MVDITMINPYWEKGIFNHVTYNLLSDGKFLQNKDYSIPNLLDLLNQALYIVITKSKDFKEMDTFFSGIIELPSGEKQKIFIQQNETGKFTIILPEDY